MSISNIFSLPSSLLPCVVIAHQFMTHSRRPTKATAGMLLCAILSDTLNLQGPTTTEWDRLMVAVLVEIAEVSRVVEIVS